MKLFHVAAAMLLLASASMVCANKVSKRNSHMHSHVVTHAIMIMA